MFKTTFGSTQGMKELSESDRNMMNRINDYAAVALADIDPQKTQVSVQLEKLRPVMEEISAETGESLDDIFIKYMDLASLIAVSNETEFQTIISENEN